MLLAPLLALVLDTLASRSCNFKHHLVKLQCKDTCAMLLPALLPARRIATCCSNCKRICCIVAMLVDAKHSAFKNVDNLGGSLDFDEPI